MEELALEKEIEDLTKEISEHKETIKEQEKEIDSLKETIADMRSSIDGIVYDLTKLT